MNKTLEYPEIATQTWVLDPSHSKVQFSVKHMVISEVVGQFKKFELTVNNPKDDFADSEFELKVETPSIDTGVQDRDNHLRSADFFDSAVYPYMIFKSTSFKKVDDEKFKLLGTLTIKNITKPVELNVVYNGQITDPFSGKKRAGFRITGSLNRFDYDLKWNVLIETGGAVVGKTININCDVELVKE
ncbi:MAG: polyisoprenoid-binding protein [Ignavibacteriales bacterium]|nr:MAG: polyisoprenoid-binding protein [Ignavibacteriales bacterium]